jgi:TfoX/Sxy family transcriptional regulator of competence genes
MFGGITFMLHGKMCCGVVGNELVVRVGRESYDEAVSQPHVRPMDFTGRPLKGFVFVGPGGYETDEELAKWVKQATKFVSSLRAKPLHSIKCQA